MKWTEKLVFILNYPIWILHPDFFAYFLFEKSQNHLFKQTQNCVNQNIRKLLTVLASANGTCTMDYKLHVWIYCNQQYNDVIECLVTKNRVKIKKKKGKINLT